MTEQKRSHWTGGLIRELKIGELLSLVGGGGHLRVVLMGRKILINRCLIGQVWLYSQYLHQDLILYGVYL